MKRLLLIALVAAGCGVKAQSQIDTNYIRIISSRHHSTQMIYRDTLNPSFNGCDYTLYSYETNNGSDLDTMYQYNHYQYIRQWVIKEQEYWRKEFEKHGAAYRKTGNVDMFHKSENDAQYFLYWSGVNSGLDFILNHRLEPDFNFKMRTKKP